jgi:ubiquinol-cytochrome c reductase cytochrome c1 subunit
MNMRIALGLGISLGILLVAANVASAQTITLPAIPPKDVGFSFVGPFGHYDRASLQRGFQVYKEVCSACHSLNLVAFHNLDETADPASPRRRPRRSPRATRFPRHRTTRAISSMPTATG